MAEINKDKLLLSKDQGQISSMFDDISHKYDFLNHFLSFGFDKLWRKKAVKLLRPHNPLAILDIATGTGDFAIEALKLRPEKITGIDISVKMIEIAKIKVKRLNKENIIGFYTAASEKIPEKDQSFDAITVGFGVRNFEDLMAGLSEMNRVLKKGGVVMILEFSVPEALFFKWFYYFYFRFITPLIGRLFSKHKFAYTYLPDSVYSFPSGTDFLTLLEKAGFSETGQTKLTFGVATIYTGIK